MGLATFLDTQGNFYVAGQTQSSNFPTTAGGAQRTYGGSQDAFVSKFDASGKLVYSSYLGGTGLDEARGVVVDRSGNIYVAGFTQSVNFPTANALDSSLGGSKDAFLTKISPSGGILFSTYFGGSAVDNALAMAVDSAGSVYLTGDTESTNFPTSAGAFATTARGNVDAYATKFNSNGTLAYSTYLGSPGFDDGLAMTVDSSGDAFITGKASPGFPTTPGAYDTTQNGGYDMFVTKVNPTGTALGYSTYIGGNNWDEGLGIAVDASGNAYFTGNVQSPNYPTTPGAYRTSFIGSGDTAITKLNSAGSALVYSTLLGGSSWAEGDGLAIDSSGNAYIAGHLGATDYPTTPNAAQPRSGGGVDGFLTKINSNGTRLLYSTYVGGGSWDGAMAPLSIDAGGNAYLSGGTSSTTYPVTSGASQPTLAGGYDAMATKIATPDYVPPSSGPPANTAAPVLSGTAEQGQTLTTSDGSWTGSPTSFSYRWQRCNSTGGSCITIAGASARQYVLTASDVGLTVRSQVTATNTAGASSTTSSQSALVSGVLVLSPSNSGDDGDVGVSSPLANGYPPQGTPTPNTTGSTLTAGRRNVSGGYEIDDVLLRFDTSPLPDNATILSAVLNLQVNKKADSDNLNVVGEWYSGSNWPIDAGDYNVGWASNAIAAVDISALPTSAVYPFQLQSLIHVSPVGYTGLRIHIDGGAPSGDNDVQFAAYDSSGLPKPQLVVRYRP